MKELCQLASRDSIRASYSQGVLLIVATGSVSAGDRVDIDMDPSGGSPPQFRLERCPRPGVWPRVMVPYTHRESFLLTRHPERVRIAGSILVHHQDGTDEVELEGFADDLPRGLLASDDVAGQQRVTGYSRQWSFDEAFADAMAMLGGREATHPDELFQVRVEEVGGLFGGIAGFNDLYVTLVAPRAPSRPGPIVVEVRPERPPEGGEHTEVISEVAPGRVRQPEGEVITEVAPGRVPRPDGGVIVEVAPDRPGTAGRKGPISEVAPERPETS